MNSTPQPSWFEHVDLMQVALVLAMGYIVWSLRGFLGRFEKNISKLFQLYGDLKSQVDILQGEHNAMVCAHPNRRKTDTETAGK